MKYKIVNLSTSAASDPKSSVLIIYTGGTFGMALDDTGSLAPFNFSLVIDKIPELKAFDLRITVISFPAPEDSSNINTKHWVDLGYIIYENYSQYDGFVVLHGTDTMAFTASALSFMLEGLNKPVILTGAQIPIGFLRSDARENLITALEIASAKNEGKPIVNEVCVYFNYFLLRGNRSQKLRSSTFAAFESENYPKLAEAGVFIEYNYAYLRPHNPEEKLNVRSEFDDNVAVVKLYPGIPRSVLEQIFSTKGLRAVVADSKYVLQGMQEWMEGWKSRGWKRRSGGKLAPVKNDDLWTKLDVLIERHKVKYTRVKGHSGHPENDRVDELAVEAYQQYK
ncbi:MAG: asparaginase domain-containing protein [Bacteroidota bacterium]